MALTALTRQLAAPRAADRSPAERGDHAGLAAMLAFATGVTLMLPVLYAALYSRLWHDHRPLAYVVILGGCLLSASAMYVAARPLTARYGLRVWQCALAGVVLAAAGWAGPKAAAYIWPRVEDRYTCELVGAGQCLHDSPYELDRVVTTFEGADRSVMVVSPPMKSAPVLRLANARNGGVQSLAPADQQSRQILASYGC